MRGLYTSDFRGQDLGTLFPRMDAAMGKHNLGDKPVWYSIEELCKLEGITEPPGDMHYMDSFAMVERQLEGKGVLIA